MPIPAGTSIVVPPPVEVASPDIPIAWWFAPDGSRWDLWSTKNGWWTTDAGITGAFGAAPVVFTTDNSPRGGTSMRWIQPDARTITWPLRVEGDTHAEFLSNWRAISDAFTQTRRGGPGTLVIARPDGSARQIDAYYQEGWVESGGQGLSQVRYDMVSLTLYCPDPYWRDAQPTLVTRSFSTAGSYLSPYPTVSSSQTLGNTTITTHSQVETWPDWTITGPATSITATNNTTGISWSLTPSDVLGRNLNAGETITITGNPPDIEGPTASVAWETAIDWTSSDLWPLLPGDNDVTFSVSGSGAGTSITLSYYGRYETA